jgi:DNA-directed RNA polymerase subunit M/transcription elongation factor TFIIS
LILKTRVESPELLTLRHLSSRKMLSDTNNQYYLSLEKGYEGEIQFDKLAGTFLSEWLYLNDLLLKHNNSLFQIDSLGITQNCLYIFDVKNYEGDYIIHDDIWRMVNGKELKNPLHQLQRCESLFKGFLQEKGVKLPIKSYLIFINPHFTLYQAPLNSTIIFPSQITQFIKKLQKESVKLDSRHSKIADIILGANHDKSPYSSIPEYTYHDTPKGIVCSSCSSLITTLIPKMGKLVCSSCSHEEKLEEAILRSVQEYTLLFPKKKVSTVEISDWCNHMLSKKQMYKILTKNFERKGQGKYSFYV